MPPRLFDELTFTPEALTSRKACKRNFFDREIWDENVFYMRWLLFSLNGICRTQTSRNFYSTLITQFTGLKSQLLVLAAFLRFANPRCNCTIFFFHFPLLDEIGKFHTFATVGRLSEMRKFKSQARAQNQTVHDELVPKTENVVGAARSREGNFERGARREESNERVYQQVGATRKYRTMFGGQQFENTPSRAVRLKYFIMQRAMSQKNVPPTWTRRLFGADTLHRHAWSSSSCMAFPNRNRFR